MSMKKWFLLFAVCFYSFIVASPIQDHTIDRTALSELASTLGIARDADIIVETQNKWLRKAGQERWEMAELTSEQRLFVALKSWAKRIRGNLICALETSLQKL